MIRTLFFLVLVLLVAGCAKYNTYYNAKKAFDDAERVRDDAIKRNEDPPPPAGNQKANYDRAIQKAQRVLDEYPGTGLTDDALFLQAKSWHRLESYRMSIRKLDLLFQNYPATDYLEESLYLQGLNYLLIGAASRSQEYLDRLQRKFPDSDYRAEVLKVSGDNAFALQAWQDAAIAYTGYLDQEGVLQERDRIGLKLAQCQWELDDYYAASAVLNEVSQSAESRELRFRCKLLQARVHVRIGDFEVVDLLLVDLRQEAELYQSRGEVRLIEAESLVAQGRGDEATPLLESMPPEWEQDPGLRARTRDMLGYLYMERDDWEEADKMFTEALRRRQDLEDPERTRLYSESLKSYLSAEQNLVDARPEDVPRYQLLQANSLLFGFQRPALAADLYMMAAADTAADSTIAARALYGAYLTYRDRLDRPDSAAIFAAQLEERYPDSPQGYEVREGGESDLLGYLLAQRSVKQAEAYAALSDSARALLIADIGTMTGGAALVRPGQGTGIRRRMVYLQRRDNLVFAATAEQMAAAARRNQDLARQEQQQAAADSSWAAAADTAGAGPAPGATTPVPDGGAAAGAAVGAEAAGQATGETEETGAAAGEETPVDPEDPEGKKDKDEKSEDEEEDKEKEKRDDNEIW